MLRTMTSRRDANFRPQPYSSRAARPMLPPQLVDGPQGAMLVRRDVPPVQAPPPGVGGVPRPSMDYDPPASSVGGAPRPPMDYDPPATMTPPMNGGMPANGRPLNPIMQQMFPPRPVGQMSRYDQAPPRLVDGPQGAMLQRRDVPPPSLLGQDPVIPGAAAPSQPLPQGRPMMNSGRLPGAYR